MSGAIIGASILIALAFIARLVIELVNFGVAGALDRSAERAIRRAVRRKALADTYRLMRRETPGIYRGFEVDHWRGLGR